VGGGDPTSGGVAIKRVEPDYGDPLFLEKHGRFIRALAEDWSNVGVGKLYRQHRLALYLLDSAGAVVHRQVQSDVDPTQWLPGDVSVAGSLRVPAKLPAARYTLGLALVDPATENPAIRLASDAPHTDRLYRLTEVTVK